MPAYPAPALRPAGPARCGVVEVRNSPAWQYQGVSADPELGGRRIRHDLGPDGTAQFANYVAPYAELRRCYRTAAANGQAVLLAIT